MYHHITNFKRKAMGRGLLLAAIMSALFVMMSAAVPAQAQDETQPESTPEPTAMPRSGSPIMIQFDAAREAIEEEKSVDLTYVEEYRYSQQEYKAGIDKNCDEDVPDADVRPVYFGFTWTITALNGNVYQARTAMLPGNELVVSVCDEVNTAPPSGDSGSGNAGGAPAAGSANVDNFEIGGHVTGLSDEVASNMNTAGMTWVKKQIRYNLGDSPSKVQGAINDAQSRGFKILLGVVGEPAEMTNYDSYVAQFTEFLGGVAALGPDAIEVWNEPNIAREWPEGQMSGAMYTEMLKAAYNKIESNNSDVLVISGAPAPTGAQQAFPNQVVNDDNFMQQMADAGAAQYMECLGMHYNEGVVPPGQTSGDPRDDYPTRYFTTQLARGTSVFPNTPVCWTELGYLTDEGLEQIPESAPFGWAADVTLEQQANWLAEAATRSAQSGNVRLMIVWNVNFTNYNPTGDPQGGYAIMRPDGSCPACQTLGSVMGG